MRYRFLQDDVSSYTNRYIPLPHTQTLTPMVNRVIFGPNDLQRTTSSQHVNYTPGRIFFEIRLIFLRLPVIPLIPQLIFKEPPIRRYRRKISAKISTGTAPTTTKITPIPENLTQKVIYAKSLVCDQS